MQQITTACSGLELIDNYHSLDSCFIDFVKSFRLWPYNWQANSVL